MEVMNITVAGTGNMGSALARRLGEAGHRITLTGSRSGDKLSQSAAEIGAHAEMDLAAATRGADALICAMWPQAFFALADGFSLPPGALLMSCMSDLVPDFSGRTIGLATSRVTSVAEELAQAFPGHPVVEAFNLTFAGLITGKQLAQRGVLSLPFCGNDPAAKEVVASWIRSCDYVPVDVGGLEMARSLETLATAWVQFAGASGLFPNRGLSIV